MTTTEGTTTRAPTTDRAAAPAPARGRRRGMRVLAAAAAALWLAGHSPYRQWDVYRKARLVLLATAADEASVRLARALVAIYERTLPDSRPTYARARDANDQVRLLA